MKILSIDKYGTIEFKQNGSAFIDDWAFTLDDTTREPDTDELVLLLYEYLADQTRTNAITRSLTLTTMQLRPH